MSCIVKYNHDKWNIIRMKLAVNKLSIKELVRSGTSVLWIYKWNSARLLYRRIVRFMLLPISRLSSKFIWVIGGEIMLLGHLQSHFEKGHFSFANWICIFHVLKSGRKFTLFFILNLLYFVWHVTCLDNFNVKARSKADCCASVPNRFTVSTLNFLRYRNKSRSTR